MRTEALALQREQSVNFLSKRRELERARKITYNRTHSCNLQMSNYKKWVLALLRQGGGVCACRFLLLLTALAEVETAAMRVAFWLVN